MRAEKYFQEAVRLRPDWPSAACSLAWFYATLPDARWHKPAQAVRLAHAAAEQTGYQDPASLQVLAAAYADAGEFAKAIATVDRCKEVILATNPTVDVDQLDRLRAHLPTENRCACRATTAAEHLDEPAHRRLDAFERLIDGAQVKAEQPENHQDDQAGDKQPDAEAGQRGQHGQVRTGLILILG